MISNKKILGSLKKVNQAARALRLANEAQQNQVLETVASQIRARSAEILKANAKDLRLLDTKAGCTPAFKDRLTLSSARLEQMIESLRQVIRLPSPLGEVVESRVLENGLRIKRVRAPLGVIFMIFESRPNVAIEAFSLAAKSGNALILRGGKESMETTAIFYKIIRDALSSVGFSPECLWGITDPDRAMIKFLLKQKQWIDVVVPRGGEGLIEFVTENSKIPIIKNDRGLCHVYVHEDADLTMATQVVLNAKTQRPGVCNAMETLLVHESCAETFLPKLYREMELFKVEWRGCPKTCSILKKYKYLKRAQPKDWDTEHLDLIMNCRVVDSFESAVDHIAQHGSRHSEAIVTASKNIAEKFQAEVDAAAVYWNASTRFTDGFELGLGGELGISTQKLHVRGPVGLRELTSVRWVIDGAGQIRA